MKPDDELKKILQDADAVYAPAATGAGSLAQTVRGRDARQRFARRTATAAAMLLVLASFAGYWVLRGVNHPAENPLVATTQGVDGPEAESSAVEIARLRQEIRLLELDAEQAQLAARAWQAATGEDNLPGSETDPPLVAGDAWQVDVQLGHADGFRLMADEAVETAARISVQRADTLRTTFQQTQQAAAAYRAVVDHFPASRWAGVARERLEQLSNMN